MKRVRILGERDCAGHSYRRGTAAWLPQDRPKTRIDASPGLGSWALRLIVHAGWSLISSSRSRAEGRERLRFLWFQRASN